MNHQIKSQKSLTSGKYLELFNFRLRLQIVVIFLSIFLIPNSASAQYSDVNFGGSTNGTTVGISNYPSSSNGRSQGDIMLYTNVAYVDSKYVDCYIVVDSVIGCTITNADQSSTGTNYSNNTAKFFSPFTNFNTSGAK